MNDHPRRSSRAYVERILWDAEAGAGKIPAHKIASPDWTVLPLPAGDPGVVIAEALNRLRAKGDDQ